MLLEFVPMLYRYCLGENYFQKMFDKYKRNLHSGMIDSQIVIRTWDLEYPHFYEKEKTFKNIMNAADNLKVMSAFLSSGTKKMKSKDNLMAKTRKNSQIFARKSTLKKPDRKKSNAKLNMKTSYEKDSPTYISEDTSEYDSPQLTPQKSRISLYIKKKISEEK